MIREIGSEFSRVAFDSGQGFTLPVPGNLVFSGRTAIETVLKELKGAKTALLPSYCCDSMIRPFRDAGIEIGFYAVDYRDELKVEIKKDADILLWCNYFGFDVPMPDLSGFEGVIIEDITHSILSAHPYHSCSEYLVASLRKWEPINCGGFCARVTGEMRYIPTVTPPQGFINEKTAAMELKAVYLKNPEEDRKQEFLSMFGESNHWLADHYSGFSIDPWSREYLNHVDVEKQRNRRRNNAKALYRGLKNAQFLFREEDMDCPLFLPILLPDRDEVRRTLTAHQIYCPVHWPRPDGAESSLYDTELSLVCDQRYDEEDMARIVSVLNPLL